LIVYLLKGLQKKKISDFYTTLTGRKQAGIMQSAADPPKGDHDGLGKEILTGISLLFFGAILETTIGISSEMW
jgi:hypothetical protein